MRAMQGFSLAPPVPPREYLTHQHRMVLFVDVVFFVSAWVASFACRRHWYHKDPSSPCMCALWLFRVVPDSGSAFRVQSPRLFLPFPPAWLV